MYCELDGKCYSPDRREQRCGGGSMQPVLIERLLCWGCEILTLHACSHPSVRTTRSLNVPRRRPSPSGVLNQGTEGLGETPIMPNEWGRSGGHDVVRTRAWVQRLLSQLERNWLNTYEGVTRRITIIPWAGA